MNNPYQTQSDFTLDDLDFYGLAKEIDYKRKKFGSGGYETKTYWNPEYEFEGTLSDLNLTDDQITMLEGLLPGQAHKYNLASPIMDALNQVFTEYGIDLSDLGLSGEQMSGVGLDPYTYSKQVAEGGGTAYYEKTADPTVTQLNIEGLSTTDIFDEASIAETLGVLGSDVAALTPEMIEKTEHAYYQPYEFAERGALIDELSKDIGKVDTGGFASSGQRTAGLSGAGRDYRGGYQDILSQILKQRGASMDDVVKRIYDWKELAENVTS